MKTNNQNSGVQNQQVVNVLNQLLADWQLYYQNLRGLHWNVKGPMFFALHAKFEDYYNEAAATVDELAERILMVGGQPLHTYKAYLLVSKLAENVNVSDGIEAVNAVLRDSNFLLSELRDALKVASESNDEGTVALLSGLIGSTEKRIWMLSAFLG